MGTTHPLPTAISRAALLAAGTTDSEIRRALRRGELLRLAPARFIRASAYADLPADQQYVLRITAAASRRDLVVSHASAAALHGLPLFGGATGLVHFTRNGRGGSSRTAERWVHAAELPPQHRVEVRGVRVTTPARTIVDVARGSKIATSIVAGDAALNRGLTTRHELRQMLDFAIWHKGRPQACRAVAQLDGRSESPGESLVRLQLAQQGLSGAELQIEIRDEAGRFVARVDLGYLDHGVLIEFDGKVKYTALLRPGQDVTDAVLAEKTREERLTRLGWLVVRVSWADLGRPDVLAGRVRAACQDRRRLVQAGAIQGTAIPGLGHS